MTVLSLADMQARLAALKPPPTFPTVPPLEPLPPPLPTPQPVAVEPIWVPSVEPIWTPEPEPELEPEPGRKWRYIRPLHSTAETWIDYLRNTNERWMLGLKEIDVMTRGFGRGELVYVTGFAHCMTPDHEVLSERHGWVSHNQLEVGDRIWGLSEEGSSQWTNVQAVNVFDHDGELHRMYGRNMDALVTSGHRWPVSSQWKSGLDDPSLTVKLTTELNSSDYIPIARQAVDVDETYSDEEVRLLGWYVTDAARNKIHGQVTFYQSPEVNLDNCEEIEKLLRSKGWFTSTADRRRVTPVGPTVERRIGCNSTGARWLESQCPGRKLNHAVINLLSQRQRLILVDTMIAADGHNWGAGRVLSVEADEVAAASHLFASAGLAFSVRQRVCETKIGTSRMWLIYERSSKNCRIARLVKNDTVPYVGKVWCPTVSTGLILVRRNGRIFYTGNSGKTQCVLTAMLHNLAKPTILFTFDEPAELVLAKLVGMKSGRDGEALEILVKAGDPATLSMVRDMARREFGNLLVIDEPLSLSDMSTAMEEAARFLNKPVEAVVIDYLELLRSDESEIEKKSQQLKLWTKTANVPVICLHQGSRGNAGKGQALTMQSMKYGGEAEATFVLGVRRKRDEPEAGMGPGHAMWDTVSVSVLKNKRPPSKKGEADFYMDPKCGAIHSLRDLDMTTKRRTVAEMAGAV